MVAASDPTGILAGRPTGFLHTQSRQTHWTDQTVGAETTNQRHESDLYVRPSFTDASIAFDQLEKASHKIFDALILFLGGQLYRYFIFSFFH